MLTRGTGMKPSSHANIPCCYTMSLNVNVFVGELYMVVIVHAHGFL